MDEKRKGEIALAFLKHKLTKDGFEVDQNFRRRIGSDAKQAGIPFPEAIEFATNLMMDILTEVSNAKKPPTEEELAGLDGH